MRAAPALALLLAGCRAPDPAAFVGRWRLAGRASVVLGGGPARRSFAHASDLPIQGYALTLVRGEGRELASEDTLGCRLTWEAAGRGYELGRGERCTAATRRATFALETTSGLLSLHAVAPGRLSLSGELFGRVSEGGAILGREQAARAQVEGTLVRAQSVP